ncbi:signal peptide peptidase SppA [bacterium]|jgi:protease IV|nr:signal peptide peptidase SppA [bacterium]MBT5014841.1 signal peptide peptidase SppA [bacterium]
MPKISTILSTLIAIMFFLSMAPPLIKTLQKNYEEALKPKTKVGRIYIKGGITESQTYQKNLEALFKDDSVKAILLEMDCPGGTVGHSQALFLEIIALKKLYNKPIVTVVENICASGGYYIACATDFIIAPPGAIIGSIGCYIGQFKYKELMEFFKVHHKVNQSGKFKTILNPYGDDESYEGDALIQHISDEVYEQFVRDVARARGLITKKRHEWADGKIFTAKDAQRMSLINKTGYLSEAVAKIKSLANIETEIEWVRPKKPSVFKKLIGIEDFETQSYIHSFLEIVWTFFHAKAQGIENNV